MNHFDGLEMPHNTIHGSIPGMTTCEDCGDGLEPDASGVEDYMIGDAELVKEVPQTCPGCSYRTTTALLYLLGDRYIIYASAVDGLTCSGRHLRQECGETAAFQYVDIRDPIQHGCCQEHMKVSQVGRRVCQMVGIEPNTDEEIEVHLDD